MQHYLAAYGYVALLPLSIIEGPLVTIFAAFLASRGILNVAVVYVIVVVGDLIGDVLHYAVGRWTLQWLTARHRRWSERLRHRIAALRAPIQAHAGRMLLFGKLTHSAGFAVLLAAGAARVPMPRFLGYNLLGTLPKSLVLVLVGYCFGRLSATMETNLQIAGVAAFVLAAMGLVLLARRLVDNADPPGV
jgi:membrane protein DedA with SNARE-associated domain